MENMKSIEHRRKRDMQEKIEINRRNKAFAKKCKLRTGLGLTLLVGSVILCCISASADNRIITIAGLVLMIIAIPAAKILLYSTGFCPHCGEYSRYKYEYCPRCGTTLEYSETLDGTATEDKNI